MLPNCQKFLIMKFSWKDIYTDIIATFLVSEINVSHFINISFSIFVIVNTYNYFSILFNDYIILFILKME